MSEVEQPFHFERYPYGERLSVRPSEIIAVEDDHQFKEVVHLYTREFSWPVKGDPMLIRNRLRFL